MKTWKKILIVALCVLAVMATVIVCMIAAGYYKSYQQHKEYIEGYRHANYMWLSENIVMEDEIAPQSTARHWEEYVRVRDVRTGEFTTPQLQRVYRNTRTHDSLVVYVDLQGKRGYLNRFTGRITIPAQYDHAWNFCEDIGAVMKDGVLAFILTDGTPAFDKQFPIQLRWDEGFMFHNNTCAVKDWSGKWGLINRQGEWLVEPKYNSIDAPYHGFRKVMDGSSFGLLDKDNRLVLPVEYSQIRRAFDGRGFILVKDGKAWEVDYNLNIIEPFVCDRLYPLYMGLPEDDVPESEYMCSEEYKRFYITNCGCGVVDSKGNIVIPAQYYDIRMVNDNLLDVRTEIYGEHFLIRLK